MTLTIPLSKRAVQVSSSLGSGGPAGGGSHQSARPSLLARVHKIVVHPGGGAELGHVESGPQKDPQEVHLFKGRIEQMVRERMAPPASNLPRSTTRRH